MKRRTAFYHQIRTALSIYVSFILCLFVNVSTAQVTYHVQHTVGTVYYGNTGVLITSTGTVQTSTYCNGRYWISKPAVTNAARDYKFDFSVPTKHVTITIGWSETTELFSFKINNQHHYLSYNELSAIPTTTCGCGAGTDTMFVINTQGDLLDTGNHNINGCLKVDIFNSGIYSLEISHNYQMSGSALGIYFVEDTTVFIPQPYYDTLFCAGDSFPLSYITNYRFQNNNTFTAQLSNASGSFANPVNIGSRTDTTGDTIWCTIPVNTTSGNGYRVRIVSSNPADTSLDNQVNIRIKASPQSFSNSSNSPVCTTDTLRLNGSSTSTGITWAWTGPNSFTSSAEDTVIANTAMSHAGNYILTATLNSTGCSLKDTTTVTVHQTPAKPTAGSNSPVCETKTINLSTSTTTNGVSYAWTGPGYSSATQNPTVTTNAASTHAGDYISTVTINGCSNRDTVTVSVLPKPAKPTAAAPNSPLCAHQDLQLTATTINGANYTWYGPAGYYEYTQNPTRNYMQLNYAGAYYVFANLNGCISDTDSVVVVVNTDPNVSIYPTPGTTICDGQKAIFTAIPTNGGSVGYDWRVNGASKGVTTASYTTTGLKNGDEVTCLMVSIGTCATTFTDTSNAIKMVVQDLKTPSATITADAGPSLFPNEPINFTATTQDAGTNPKYQWKRNGQSVGGATGKTWGANANFLTNGDNICVLITSDYACPSPDTALSNCIKLEIRLGVEDIVRDNNIRIYPNPTSGTITVTSSAIIEQLTLTDLVGKQVLSQTGGSKIVHADMSSLAAGVYIIKVNGSVAGRVVKK
ncbi:MAG: T9SS type A sorting domain-containing protein [Chitinophagales bacterium]|nr:T9SS type A sorting domain-containing protein [Chitinophagales bacterium]